MAKAPTPSTKAEPKAGEFTVVDPETYRATVETLPPPVQPICATCAGWSAFPNDPILGSCLPSRKAMPHPLTTTNMGTCSRWAPIK